MVLEKLINLILSMFFRVVNDPLNTAKECLLLSGKTLTVMPYITYLVLGTLYHKHILHSLNSIKLNEMCSQ